MEDLSGKAQYLRDADLIAPLDLAEETHLLTVAATSQRARNRLVEGYQRLVIGLSIHYERRCKLLEFGDLVSEGNIGLIEAIEKYRSERGITFATWAFGFVRGTMLRAVWQDEFPLRLPEHQSRALRKLRRVHMSLVNEVGREPTIEELALVMQIPSDGVRDLLILQGFQVLSLDVTTQDDLPLADTLPDLRTVERDRTLVTFAEFLAALPPKEAAVMALRYEAATGTVRSHAEVAKIMGVNRAAVQVMEQRIRRQMRQYIDTPSAS